MDSTRHQPYLPCLRRHLNILQSAIAPIAARLAESPHDSAQTAANSWTDMSANAVYRASATSLDCATPHASLQPDDILRVSGVASHKRYRTLSAPNHKNGRIPMISQAELRDASYVHRLTCVASHVIAGRHVKTDENRVLSRSLTLSGISASDIWRSRKRADPIQLFSVIGHRNPWRARVNRLGATGPNTSRTCLAWCRWSRWQRRA